MRDEAASGIHPDGPGDENFVREARRDGENQRDDEGLDQAEAAALQRQNDQHVERRNHHAREQRKTEEQLQRDSRAQNFGKIARGDGDFASDPQQKGGAARIMFAAGLREIASRSDTEFGGERLEKHRHQIADEHHAEQPVAEFRAAAEVGGPVAGIHVADGDQDNRGPAKAKSLRSQEAVE